MNKMVKAGALFVAMAGLGTGLLACAGAEPPAPAPSEEAVEIEPPSDDLEANTCCRVCEKEYYSDASHTTLVGGSASGCGGSGSWGQITPYYVYWCECL